MALLSVNVNKVATLRNTRALAYPSPAWAARASLEAGAAGATVHPRPDQRHIRPADVFEIAEVVKAFPGREFNIEGNPFHGFVPLIEKVRPDQCTLVPDEAGQATSDHGFDLSGDNGRLAEVLAAIRPYTGRISLFMDPDVAQVERAAKLGVERIELYTEPYAAAFGTPGQGEVTAKYRAAAEAAVRLGMKVNAGHDLTLANLPHLIANVPGIAEVSIGHALIADALELGLAETVRRYIAAAAAAT